MNNFSRYTFYFAVFLLAAPLLSEAQVGSNGIPTTYLVSGENVQSGDVVALQSKTDRYILTTSYSQEDLFGVINTQPSVVLRNGNGGVPVMQVGEVLVNVTDRNGEISVGDMITSSVVPGKAERFDSGEGYILGYALETFDNTKAQGTILVDGQTVNVGSIRVLLDIGAAPNTSGAKAPDSATIFVREQGSAEGGLDSLFRYITAALFALGTLFVALKTFGPNIGRGVVSVGRNPLAKRSIQAMVLFNTILILTISIGAFIISLLIIFLPV